MLSDSLSGPIIVAEMAHAAKFPYPVSIAIGPVAPDGIVNRFFGFEKYVSVDANGFLAEIDAYNQAVNQRISFDPNVKDGRNTQGLAVNKSNWANTIDEPPFEAYQVGCGITFTFGGLRIEVDTAAVVNNDDEPIPGLYAAGELVGGIFYFNYPGGTELMSGSVFGRLAGSSAAGK